MNWIPSAVRNVALLGGCVMMFVGMWWERPSLALVAVGGLLAWSGYRSASQVFVGKGEPVDDR